MPTTAEEFNALPMMQKEVIRRALPGFAQSLLAQPESLPAAVYVRYKEGNLTHADLPALRAAGLDLEAQNLEASNRQAAIDRVVADFEKQKQDNFVPEDHKRANEAEQNRLRIASLNRFSRV